MAVQPLPATLAALAVLLSCTVLGRVSTVNRSLTNFYGDTTICRTIPGLTKAQIDVCYQEPDGTTMALQGLHQAVKECQHQFHNHRWNCSSVATRSKNPYASAMLQRGFRETAFVRAMSAAGVAISVSRACSQGMVRNCGCDTHKYKTKGTDVFSDNTMWKWGGCSHNIRYGMYFSKLFLDSREGGTDFQSKINRHNNRVGRLVVANNMQVKCKCHGMSGSCELKTCWRAVPDFRTVGKILKDKYKSAVFKDQPNVGSLDYKRFNEPMRLQMKQREPRDRKKKSNSAQKLQYYLKSPSFCEKEPSLDIPGTTGRSCNQTSDGPEGCSTLCCGRGYDLIRQRRTERCNCIFHWCCNVECQTCNIEEWISVCK